MIDAEWLILPAAALLLGLLYAERRESVRGLLLVKPLLSALFIAVLLRRPHGGSPVFACVLAGQIACWLGDVCLIFFSRKRIFTLGLAAFLLGHLLYSAAFVLAGGVTWPAGAALPVLLLAGGIVFVKLKPHLGPMRGAVVAYITVISIMVLGALGLAGNAALPAANRMMIAGGALSFYVSDIFVARHRFVRRQFLNRLVGLPLYYLAQFLIAWAAGGIG